ncbi:MAG TPA: tyramine oxidase, partial [Microterricola sp.]
MSHTPENLLSSENRHAHSAASSEPTVVRHPLDPLTAGELGAGRAILVAAGLLGETVRCAQVLPVEPDKDVVAAFTDGDPIDRRVHYVLLDTATGTASEAVVSITAETVVEHVTLANDQPPYGQPQYLFEE